jgi:hypothetical protein
MIIIDETKGRNGKAFSVKYEQWIGIRVWKSLSARIWSLDIIL